MKLSTQAYCKMVLHGAKYPHCAVNGLLVAEKPPPPGQRGREREREPPAAQALLVDCIPLFHGSLALAPMLEVALSLVSPAQSARICLHMLGIDKSLSHRRSMTHRLLSTWFGQLVEAVARSHRWLFTGDTNESLTKGTHLISMEEIICKALRQFNLGLETQLLNNEIDVFGKQKIDSWCRENSYVIAGYYQANERVKDASPNLLAEKVASRIAENFNDTALIMVDNTRFTMKCLKPAVHVYEHHENKWRCRDPHVDYCEDWTEAQRISESLLDSRSYETLVDFDNHLDDIRNDWTNPEINKAVLHLC